MAPATAVDLPSDARLDAWRQRVITAARTRSAWRGSDWIDEWMDRFLADPTLRTQALRFIDVLPALEDDADLVRHVIEYFDLPTLRLPRAVATVVKQLRGATAQAWFAQLVRSTTRRLSGRFMAGADATSALAAVTKLYKRGIGASLDLLGEAVVSDREAAEYQATYLALLDQVAVVTRSWPTMPLLDTRNGQAYPKVHLSLKLSALYSQMTPRDPEGGATRIAERLIPILLSARQHGVFICIDMEQYDFKDLTLHTLRQVLMEPRLRDWPHVGIALQTYLRDTEADLLTLIEWARQRGTPITIRLVRGAYWDYEMIVSEREGWSTPVWTAKAQTDANYARCLRHLFAAFPAVEFAVATHNTDSIATALALAEAHGLRPDQFEFQMLKGMVPALAQALQTLGYPLRLYYPFGELLPGMAYLVRRLLENSSSQSWQRLRYADEATAAEPVAVSHTHGRPPEFVNEPLFRFTDPEQRAQFGAALAKTRGELGRTYPLLIGGIAVDTGVYLESLNPAAPDTIVGRVAMASAEYIDATIAAAKRAYPQWAGLPADDRARFLRAAAQALRARRLDFAAFEVYEAGKNWEEADANVAEAIDYLDYYAGEALRIGAIREQRLAGEHNQYFYRPRGIGLVIPPWNFPLAILTGMLSAAIVTGNTAIVKPSSQTPVIAARFVELLQSVGVPEGVVQFLPGRGAVIGDALVSHPDVACIAFTGSEAIGTRILRLAAEIQPGQHHVKHVIAEMGGKNALIVDSDADLDEAVIAVVRSAFGYQGQKCSACARVIVVGSAYEKFLKRVIEATRSLPTGLPDDPAVFLGPVIEQSAQTRIERVIVEAQAQARLVFRGDPQSSPPGFFVPPAIFADVPAAAPLAQEEVFGPVLAVMRAATLTDAIAIANDCPYALTGGLYSRSPAHIDRARRALEVGNLYVNRKITGALVGRQPFGGFKLSGLGSQAGGPDYLRHFLLPRTVTENTVRRGFAPAS